MSYQKLDSWVAFSKTTTVSAPATMKQDDYAFNFSATTTLQLLATPIQGTEVVVSVPTWVTATVSVVWWGLIDWSASIAIAWPRKCLFKYVGTTRWVLKNISEITFVDNESKTITVTNTIPALAQVPLPTTTKLYINGIRYFEGTHYTLSGSTLTWTYTAGAGGFDILTTGYQVFVEYRRQ